MKHIFHIYHPVVVFLYIMSALILTMLTLNPVCIAISFLAGSGYAIYLRGMRKYLKTLRFVAIIFLIIAIVNPLFNHNGITILFYMGDNPITLEALLFGLASGGMLASVMVWFTCYNVIMTNEKFLHLFGRALPTAALMLSMIMRLLPVTRYKISRIRAAQAAMGLNAKSGTLRQRMAHGVRISSILMSWTMEDSIETADTMNARGYGSAKRTSFSAFSWSAHDITAFAAIAALVGGTATLMILTLSQFVYYPMIGGELGSPLGIAGYAAYALLLCFPLLLELWETLRWR